MIVKSNDYFSKYSCCETNLCNSPEFHSKNLRIKIDIIKIPIGLINHFKLKSPSLSNISPFVLNAI